MAATYDFALVDIDGNQDVDLIGTGGAYAAGTAARGVVLTLNVNPQNSPPILSNPRAFITAEEAGAPVRLSQGTTIRDEDGGGYGTNFIRVSGLTSGDRVLIQPFPQGYFVVGSTLYSYIDGKTTGSGVGSVSGGDGTDFVISLTTSIADPSTLLNSLSYYSVDRAPVNHSLTLTITDAQGASVTQSIALTINPRNDAPVLADLSPTVSIAAADAAAQPQIIDSQVRLTDPEGNFVLGALKVRGLLSGDIVSVWNEGMGAGQVGLANGSVTFGGVAVGSLSGGIGSDLTVTFNGAATTAAVDAVIEHLTFGTTTQATPGSTRTLAVSITDSATRGQEGQPLLVKQEGIDNPFFYLNVFSYQSAQVFVDLYGTGSMVAVGPAIVAEGNRIVVLAPTGTSPATYAVDTRASPFTSNLSGAASRLTFGDLDGDGDLDMVEGSGGRLYYWTNTGTSTAPAFAGSRLFDFAGGSNFPANFAGAAPHFLDADGDGDLDLVVGSQDNGLLYFENTGTRTSASYVLRPQTANPFSGTALGRYTTPTTADYDRDGDLDLVVGNLDGTFSFIENTGSATAPTYVPRSGTLNPFSGLDAGNLSAPVITDVDRDGDLDLVSGGIVFLDQTVRSQTVTITLTGGGGNGGFDSYRYISGYSDLLAAYRNDPDGAYRHYVNYGQAEGRSPTAFDPLRYVASNPDLIATLGTDIRGASQHYATTGSLAGRPTTSFDPLLYLASNPDLARSIGYDAAAAEAQYIQSGYAAGRPTTGFDALLYGASNADLARGFAGDVQGLLAHFITAGLAEGRKTSGFDARLYGATHGDLARGFGDDAAELLRHYLDHGADEGRAARGFDPTAYLLTYADLGGMGSAGALTHWLTAGAREGRIGDAAFGREQAVHQALTAASTEGDMDFAGDRDWYPLTFAAGQRVVLDATGPGVSQGATLAIYDPLGRLVASDTGAGGSDDAALSYTAPAAGSYFVVVTGSGSSLGDYFVERFDPPSRTSVAHAQSIAAPAEAATLTSFQADFHPGLFLGHIDTLLL